MREFVPWGTQKDWSNVYSETRNVSIAKSQKIGNVFNPYIELSRLPARRRVLYRKTNGALQIWRKMVCFSRDFTFLINISKLIATPHKTNLQQGAYIHPLLSLIRGNFPRSLTRRLCHADEPQWGQTSCPWLPLPRWYGCAHVEVLARPWVGVCVPLALSLF